MKPTATLMVQVRRTASDTHLAELDNGFKFVADSYPGIVFQVFVVVPSLAGFIGSLALLIRLGTATKFELNVAQTIMWLEMIGNLSTIFLQSLILVRIYFGAINPMNMRSLYSEFWAQFFYITSMPFSITGNLLLLMYWYAFSIPSFTPPHSLLCRRFLMRSGTLPSCRLDSKIFEASASPSSA